MLKRYAFKPSHYKFADSRPPEFPAPTTLPDQPSLLNELAWSGPAVAASLAPQLPPATLAALAEPPSTVDV